MRPAAYWPGLISGGFLFFVIASNSIKKKIRTIDIKLTSIPEMIYLKYIKYHFYL